MAMIKSGNMYFTVTGTSCKVRFHEILLEQFKTPITENFKLAKSMLKSNVLVVYCVTDNQITKLEKIDSANIITLTRFSPMLLVYRTQSIDFHIDLVCESVDQYLHNSQT